MRHKLPLYLLALSLPFNLSIGGSSLLSSTSEKISFTLPGLEVASVEDPTQSTGATLFYFPKGARASFDARGGSVAASETTLLEEGSYSNQIDAVVFAGGSTMGLAAGDGVRKVLFDARAAKKVGFDMIPSVPTAVVYDYANRNSPKNHPTVYPNSEMGALLMSNLDPRSFTIGRAGAGTSTSIKKENKKKWRGGQGAASKTFSWGSVFVASIVNAMGDVMWKGKSITDGIPPMNLLPEPPGARGNTTLSIVVTDALLDRSQLKRLAVMVHTSMAATVQPFHTYYDGDILFAVSTGNDNQPKITDDDEWELEIEAAALMKQAVAQAILVANGKGSQLP